MEKAALVAKEPKVKNTFLVLVVAGISLFSVNGNASSLIGAEDNKDHDYRHITFVNQTKQHIKFIVKDGGDKNLESHSANYTSLGKCEDDKDHEFKIQFKHVIHHGMDDWLNDEHGKKLTVKRKCGEYLYLWHANGQYHTGREPHLNADLSGCNKNTDKKAILFAHGYNDTQKAWGTFATHAKGKAWRVFRTSVSQDGSMRKRAHMLAKYINQAAEQCNIDDGKLRVVAHSMGGLDIRYLVSNPGDSGELRDSAKKIERIYTLATPHQGDNAANLCQGMSDACRDLAPGHVDWFNSKNLYADFKAHGASEPIPLLALRFKCGDKQDDKGSDGVVSVRKQIYPGAKMSKHIYRARHTDGAGGAACRGLTPPTIEIERISILDKILKDHHGDNIATAVDKKHIILVNRTKKHMKFVIEGASDISLHGHSNAYAELGDCKDYEDSKYKIQFKHILHHSTDDWLNNKTGGKLTARPKCGDTLYLTHSDGNYHANIVSPN